MLLLLLTRRARRALARQHAEQVRDGLGDAVLVGQGRGGREGGGDGAAEGGVAGLVAGADEAGDGFAVLDAYEDVV